MLMEITIWKSKRTLQTIEMKRRTFHVFCPLLFTLLFWCISIKDHWQMDESRDVGVCNIVNEVLRIRIIAIAIEHSETVVVIVSNWEACSCLQCTLKTPYISPANFLRNYWFFPQNQTKIHFPLIFLLKLP